MSRKPFTALEMDMDRCSRRFGVGGCTAALGGGVACKCFNTIETCPVPDLYLQETFTLRFCEARSELPQGVLYFPVLESVSLFSASVNLAGSDAQLSPFGRRATVKVRLRDFAYHDRAFDYYQAERVSGAAQANGVGYDPATLGTFFGRLKARWPYYSGRPARLVTGYIEGGALVDVRTRNFVNSDMAGPDDLGGVSVELKDILDLADNDRALAPAPSKGYLAADLSDVATSATLTPAGIGADYPASGRVRIGSEIMGYTRAGDVLTLTARGLSGTEAASHSAADTVQEVLRFVAAPVDEVYDKLFRVFAKMPAEFLPLTKWADEVTRWLPDLRLDTEISEPTGVKTLAAELDDLGFSIWWDDVAQEVGLKANRPIDGDAVFEISDDANIVAISQTDQNEDRLTEIFFHTVQIDATKGVSSSENFRRVTATYDFDAKDPKRHGDTRAKRIYSRWFNNGADNVVNVVAARLLMRFSSAPVQVRVTLDAKDLAIGLTDVVMVNSKIFQDKTGKAKVRAMQVVAKSEPKPGHNIELTLQDYPFTARYGYSTPNARGVYDVATDAEKAVGCYAVGASLKFPDGTGPYLAI